MHREWGFRDTLFIMVLCCHPTFTWKYENEIQECLSAYSASPMCKTYGACSGMKYTNPHCAATDSQVNKTGQRHIMIKAQEKCVLLVLVIETSFRNQWETASAIYWLEWSEKVYGVCETWQRVETSWMEGRAFWLGEWLEQECRGK